MKRMTLSIDLEDNELFDKEITKIIKAKVRTIAREEHDKIVQEEVIAEVKRLVESSEYLYRERLKNIVKLTVSETMTEVIKGMDIDSITREIVNTKIDSKVTHYTSIVDQRCKEVLETTINEQLKEKLTKIFSA